MDRSGFFAAQISPGAFNLASLNNFDNCAILAAMRRASSRVSSFVIKKSSAEISALIALCVTVLCVPMVPSAVNILVLGV
jgi:hypothetical protein